MRAQAKLLIHADKVFNALGYRGASMGEVAKAAGVTRQALYHHFPNKAALFEAMIADGHSETVNGSIVARDRALKSGADFEVVVAAMLDARFGAMLRWMRATPHWGEILEEVARRCGHVVEKETLRFHKLLVDLIDAEIKAKRLRLADGLTADELALAFATVARGVNLMLPPPDAERVREDYERYVRLLINGANTISRRKKIGATAAREATASQNIIQ